MARLSDGRPISAHARPLHSRPRFGPDFSLRPLDLDVPAFDGLNPWAIAQLQWAAMRGWCFGIKNVEHAENTVRVDSKISPPRPI